MGGLLPLPGSRQTGWKGFLLLCGIWGVGNFCPRQCVRRCMDRLKVGEKIEKSEAPNAPLCGICQNRTFLSNGHFLQLSNEHIFVVWAYFKMRRRRPSVRENPLTPTHGREPRSSVRAFPLPGVRPNKTDAASATGDSVRWCVYGFLGGVPVPDSGPSPGRRRSADRLLAGDCHEPDLGPGGAEQPVAEGLAFEAPQPDGQRRDHLQTVQLHAVNDPQRAAPAQRLRAVDGPDVGPHGRLEDPEQPGYLRLCEPDLAPGRAADRDPLPVDCNRPRENALHRRRHYKSVGSAFISRRMVWSSTLA